MHTEKEIHRLVSLLDDLQKGQCWIGYNVEELLETIDADLAQKKAYDSGNTIWQLVYHISAWRKHLVKRLLHGKDVPFNGPQFWQPANPGAENWEQTLQDFEESYLQLRATINDLPQQMLDEPLPGEENQYTYYKQIAGAMQHDAFHLGQILLIRRMHEGQGG